jgi:hypothetical protein
MFSYLESAHHMSQPNVVSQSPVSRPLRVFAPSEEVFHRDSLEVSWSHADAALTVVLAELVDFVHVRWF